MFVRRSLILSVGFLTLAWVVGCSQGLGNFATVTGTVKFNGNPVDGAKVTFHGTTESEGKADIFVTTTDASGKYMIAGSGKNAGIPPGMYKVVIVKYNTKDGGAKLPEGIDQGQLDAMISDSGGAGGKTGVINLLPKEYSSVGSTKLSVTVEPGKNEGKDFDLKGK